MVKHNIHTLAQLAGVSAATVSRVLNGNPQVKAHLREKVLQALQDTGFQPDARARSLRKGATRTVSMVLPMVDTEFYFRLLRAFSAVLDGSELELVLHPLVGTLNTRRYQQAASLPYQADALVLASLNPGAFYQGQPIPFHRPICLLDTQHPDHPSFAVDNFAAGQLAASHLCSFPEPIVLVGLAQDLGSPAFSPVLQARWEGIQQAVREHGRTIETAHYLELGTEGGRQVAREVMARSAGPVQFLCMADTVALGVLRQVREAGFAARVLGFDDHSFAAPEGLTSVAQPIEDMARQAARHLLKQLAGQATGTPQVVLQPHLKVRESTRSLHPQGRF